MQTPVEIAFHACEPSDALRAEIDRQARRLEKFSSRLTSCHVAVTKSARHKHGDLFQVDVRIAMPGHKDVIVNAAHGDAPEHEHAMVAVRDAFDAAVRQIEDAMRDLRGETKQHAEADHGRVARFLAGEDCGFIETPDGREVFFHRNAVGEGGFDDLKVGGEVRFVEEAGEKGPQASTVHPIGKHHLS
jgi:cold shock CspA family protein